MYRVGLPFWKLAARAGVTMSLRVIVRFDKEAKVYIATSPDLRNLVVEARTMDDLVRETDDVIDMLLELETEHDGAKTDPAYHVNHAAVCA